MQSIITLKTSGLSFLIEAEQLELAMHYTPPPRDPKAPPMRINDPAQPHVATSELLEQRKRALRTL